MTAASWGLEASLKAGPKAPAAMLLRVRIVTMTGATHSLGRRSPNLAALLARCWPGDADLSLGIMGPNKLGLGLWLWIETPLQWLLLRSGSMPEVD